MKNLAEILENIENLRVKTALHDEISLVAASKYVGISEIQALFAAGQRIFGENQVQALKEKMANAQNSEIIWHFIGNLQSNKINQLLACQPAMWQSCNSFSLAAAVNKRLNFTLDTLLEINIADEISKSGIEKSEAIETYLKIQENCPKINLCGIMTIGAHTDEKAKIQKSFEETFKIFENLRKFGAKVCSMGMSSDYELAINCGSNMVRLGSILFK